MTGRIRDHLRGNLVGYLALFIALSGTAYAAHKINGKQIKPNSIPGDRIQNGSLTGQQVNSAALGTVPSATHAANADQATNSNQLGGASPSDYGAVLIGRIKGLTTAASTTDFGSPSGTSSANTTESAVSMVAPNHSLTARDLSVELNQGTGGGTRTFQLSVNGSTSGSISCVVPGVGTTCTSGSATEAIPANATLSIAEANSAFPSGAGEASFALRLTP